MLLLFHRTFNFVFGTGYMHEAILSVGQNIEYIASNAVTWDMDGSHLEIRVYVRLLCVASRGTASLPRCLPCIFLQNAAQLPRGEVLTKLSSPELGSEFGQSFDSSLGSAGGSEFFENSDSKF